MDVSKFIDAYGETGVVVFLLLAAALFFMKRYDAQNKETIERFEKTVNNLEDNNKRLQDASFVNTETIREEHAKNQEVIASLTQNKEALETILKYIRSVQLAYQQEQNREGGKS